MAKTLESASLVVARKFVFKDALDDRNVVDTLDKTYTSALSNGAGANKGQIAVNLQSTLGTASNEEWDLTAIATAFGDATLTKIKQIVIEALTLTTGYRLLVGGAASNAWETWTTVAGSIVRVDAGGILAIGSPVDGAAVNGTNKILKVANPSGGDFTYRLTIIGEGSIA